MLSIFRRFTNSRVGVVVTFLVLALIALAFVMGDVSGLTGGGAGGGQGDAAVTADGGRVTAAELRDQVNNEIQSLRQGQPGLDPAQYAAAGGLDFAVERMATGLALDLFGTEQGLVVSQRSVGGQIAGLPVFRGPTGQFDQNLYEQRLAALRLTDAEVRSTIRRGLIADWMTGPQQRVSFVPAQVALPYASLLLEKRSGSYVAVPFDAVPAGPAPTDAEVQAFYTKNIARYSVPERRVVRYAALTPADVAARAVPTEAEIARAYQAARAQYAATERRTVAQVIVADQAGANALAAAVRGGRSVADAARAAGLEASTQSGADKAAYAASSGQAAADAAFAAPRGGVIGPVRGPLGWLVGRVEKVEQVAGRTLEQVRPELVAAAAKQKTADLLVKARDAADDALSNRATFDEVVQERGLKAATTRPLLANGTDPDNPVASADPAVLPAVQAAFAMEEGDQPQVVTIGADGGFAVAALGSVVPAAPRPLAQVRARVAADLAADRARDAARRVADGIAARARGPASLASAVKTAGVALPAPRPVSVPRSQLASAPREAQPALALLFAMAPGTAKVLPSPDGRGWTVVKLEGVQRASAAGDANLVRATRADLGRAVGREYAEQFARAARAAVNARVNAAAVAAVRRDLTGGGGAD